MILLVDKLLKPALELVDPGQTSSALAQLQKALVSDGWSVKTLEAPRHDDLNWTAVPAINHPGNPANRAAVAALIRNPVNQVANVPNVVFLLGHVTIPYSGTSAHDGHTADHKGAWVCDAYYGYLDDNGWTDTWPPDAATAAAFPDDFAVAGDGKFDQSFLKGGGTGPVPSVLGASTPGVLKFAVGRLDFARMPAFSSLAHAPALSFSPAAVPPRTSRR